MNISTIIDTELSEDVLHSSNRAHKIFANIYANYKKYNYTSFEECKISLLSTFSLCYSIDIDMNIINELLKQNNESINRGGQEDFRNILIDKFGCCIITRYDVSECEAAHIIDLKEDPLNYNIDNGLLLTASLHTSFDKLIWTINPYTYDIEINEKYKNNLIHQYKNVNLKNIFTEEMTDNLIKKYYNFKHNV